MKCVVCDFTENLHLWECIFYEIKQYNDYRSEKDLYILEYENYCLDISSHFNLIYLFLYIEWKSQAYEQFGLNVYCPKWK